MITVSVQNADENYDRLLILTIREQVYRETHGVLSLASASLCEVMRLSELVLGHFADRHFAYRYFANRHFADRRFADRTFRRQDISPTDISPTEIISMEI